MKNISKQPLKQEWTDPKDNSGINGLVAVLLYQDTFSSYTALANMSTYARIKHE